MSFVTDITTKEKFWNVWMDEDWYINLARMHVVGVPQARLRGDGPASLAHPGSSTESLPRLLSHLLGWS